MMIICNCHCRDLNPHKPHAANDLTDCVKTVLSYRLKIKISYLDLDF